METSKVIREVGFGVIFAIVVILIIGFIFYEFIPSKVVPEPENYSQAATTTKLLSQIKEEQQAELEDNTDEVLKSYEITSDDLYYGSDTEYIKGKNHPFYDYTTANSDTSGSGVTVSDAPSSSSIQTITESGSTPSSSTSTNTSRINTNTLRDTSDQNRISK